MPPTAAEVDAAIARALGPAAPPPRGSERLCDFVCHEPGARTPSCPDLAASYARMMRVWGRRRFDVYARSSVSPAAEGSGTLARAHFRAWAREVRLNEALDAGARARMREARAARRRRGGDVKSSPAAAPAPAAATGAGATR